MSNDLPPVDVISARKARVNNDLVKICSTPVPSYFVPSARGIGLFTHVAGPKTAGRNPHFAFTSKPDGEVALLPLGGPRKVKPRKPLDTANEEVAAVYKELQDAVQAEEKIWKDMRDKADARGEVANDAYKMSLETLKKKYGSVDAPEGVTPPLNHPEHNKRRASEATSDTDDEAAKRRRTSQPSGDAPVGGTDADAERRGSTDRTGNIYEAYRDPRRRGR